MAKSSSGEIRTQLYLAHDLGYISEEDFTLLMDLSVETSRLISGFIRYLKTSKITGRKFI